MCHYKMTNYYFIHDYGEAKNKFEELLSFHDKPIILLGNGENGKTHLVKEMKHLGHMHSGWSWNPEYFPEKCIDNNGLAVNQPCQNVVYELRDKQQLSYINVPHYVIDMMPLRF